MYRCIIKINIVIELRVFQFVCEVEYQFISGCLHDPIYNRDGIQVGMILMY